MCETPGWRVHRFVDLVSFGKSYSKIHRKMDEPFVFFGRGHRIFYHDVVSAELIAQECYPNDADAVEAALLHILTDEVCSSDPVFRKLLEKMALLNRPNKRKPRKKKKEQDPLLRKLESDAKKLEKLQRFLRALYSRAY